MELPPQEGNLHMSARSIRIVILVALTAFAVAAIPASALASGGVSAVDALAADAAGDGSVNSSSSSVYSAANDSPTSSTYGGGETPVPPPVDCDSPKTDSSSGSSSGDTSTGNKPATDTSTGCTTITECATGDADGKDATLKRAGHRTDISWTHADGKPRAISYAVPNANQCKGCHDVGGQLTPIGPKLRNLETGPDRPAATRPLPRWDDAKAPLDQRARAYLDGNCGHCHNRNGPADTSGLWLDWDDEHGPNLGIRKRPVAAGRGSGQNEFDILPGQPDKSILITRMQSLDPGVAMPELGRATVHEEAISMLSAWISHMPQ